MLARRLILPLLALLGCLALAPAALAGSITLRISLRVSLAGDQLTARINVANQGPEAAHRLRYNIFLGQRTAQAEGAPLLAAGASDQREITLPFSEQTPGSYGLGARVDYQDAQGYPLSAVAWGLFARERFAAPRLALVGRAGHPWPGQPPAYVLKNPLESPLEVRLSVLVPAEFSPGRLERTLRLAPGQEAAVPLEISNRAALPGSTYPLAGLASYLYNGTHYTAAAQTLLTVGALSDPLYAWRPWLWALAALLLGLILGLAWRARRRGGRP